MSTDGKGGTRLRARAFRRFALSGHREFIVFPALDTCLVADVAMSAIFGLATHPITPQALVERAQAELARMPDQAQRVAPLVAGLIQADILVEDERAAALLSSTAIQDSSAVRIDTLCVLTRDRPRSVALSVESHLENAKTFGHSPRVVVVDQSADPAVAAQVRVGLEALAKRFGAPIQIYDQRRIARFGAELARISGVEARIVGFGCSPGAAGFSAGAARNLMALLATGGAFYSFDDDVTCHPRRLIGSEAKHFRLTTKGEEVTLNYPDLSTRESISQRAEFDLLGEQNRVLGKRLPTLISDPGFDRDCLTDLETAALERWEGRQATVKAAVLGVYGHPGTPFPTSMLYSSGKSRAFNLATQDRFVAAMAGSYVFKGYPRFEITPWRPFMMGAYSLDCRDMFPPCSPWGRGEDASFGVVHGLLRPHDLLAHIPVSLEHRSQDGGAPPVYRGLMALPYTSTFAQILQGCLSEVRVVSRSGYAEGLRAVGTQLKAVSSLKREDFEAYARDICIRNAAANIRHITGTIVQHGGKPDYWRDQMQSLLEGYESSLQHERFAWPGDVEDSSQSRRSAMVRCQELIGNYGCLLEAWPALINAAPGCKDLAEE